MTEIERAITFFENALENCVMVAHKPFETALTALRRTAEDDKAREEGRLIILPPSANEGDPKPDCFEDYGGSLWCLGYQQSETDDEPCERCKRCWYCEDGDHADDGPEVALGGGGDG